MSSKPSLCCARCRRTDCITIGRNNGETVVSCTNCGTVSYIPDTSSVPTNPLRPPVVLPSPDGESVTPPGLEPLMAKRHQPSLPLPGPPRLSSNVPPSSGLV